MVRILSFILSLACLGGMLYYDSAGDTDNIIIYGVLALFNYITVVRCENDN